MPHTKSKVKTHRPAKPSPVLSALNSPFPGCCTPYPDATFVNSTLVAVFKHHNGKMCAGYMEPMDIQEYLNG